ncbi:hypothetical protein D3C77_594840 [compost metagenome]
MLAPLPEAPTPPNGLMTSSLTVWSLICSRPVRNCSPSRRARPVSRDKMAALRPYSVSLASATASSSLSNGTTTATGPKISSLKAGLSRFTPLSTVAWKNRPSADPPVSKVAPAARAASTMRSALSRWAVLISGPRWTWAVLGSPTVKLRALATRRWRKAS